MKKFNLRVIIACVLVLSIGCTLGASSVSALSIDGESILSELVSAGTSLGIDIGDFIITTTTSSQYYSGNAENDLRKFLDEIGFDFSESKIIELTDYVLNRKGSFADWIYDNYGDSIVIPPSVGEMTETQIVMFMMGNILYPGQTTASTSKYVFTTKKDNVTQAATTQETATTQIVTAPETQNKSDYVTGDIDGDGKVTAKDARLALRASASLTRLSGESALAADVNGDGRITAKDARSILRYSAKLSTGF